MIVRNIIDNKPSQTIVTVKPSDSVTLAIELLVKHRIGALIVSGDGSIVDGIFSERDIVRALAKRGAAALDAKVEELMTAEVIGCKWDDTVMSVMEKMTDGRFRHMPVIEESRMVGVISIGDAVKARIGEVEMENSALTGMISNQW